MVTALLLCTAMLLPAGDVQEAPTAPAPERLNAVWALNKDLSTKPAAVADRIGGGEDRSGGAGRRGGFSGGRGGGRGRGGAPGDAQQAMRLLRELGQSPDTLTIVSRDGLVSITDNDGVTRRFTANGKAEKVAIAGETIDVKTRWTDEVLDQEFKIGSTTLVRMIETTTDGHQLVITVKPKKESELSVGQIQRFVYDRRLP
jgi:hypothetical protein